MSHEKILPMTQFNPTKTKNDAPRGRRLLMINLILGTAIIAGAIAMMVLNPRTTPGERPPGTLYYSSAELTYSLNLQTGEKHEVPSHPMLPMEIGFPAESPDGRWTATWQPNATNADFDLVILDNKTHETVHTVDLDVGITTRMTQRWSPDSEWLVLSGQPHEVNEAPETTRTVIWLIHRESGEMQLVSDDTSSGILPAFDPTSRYLAYVEQDRLWVLEFNQSGEAHWGSVSQDSIVKQFVWSPDGQWLVYTSESALGASVWAVRADHTENQPLPVNEPFPRLIDWQP
jgi:Tol biopolymer transport system component